MFTFASRTTLIALLLAVESTLALPNPTASTYFGSNSGIGIIENLSEKTSGFLVYTSDDNYALTCPHLHHLGWESISVNEQQAFLVTKDKKAITTPLSTLGFKNLATLDYIKSEFLLNLAGLSINYPNRLATSYKVLYTSDGKFQGTILPNGNLASPLSAVGAAGGLNGINGFDGTYLAGAPQGTPLSGSSQATLTNGNSAYSSYGLTSTNNIKEAGAEYLEKDGYIVRYCNNQISNYYNTNVFPNLTRTGDVYFFDYCGHALDVYSDTISTSVRPVGTAVYRDANFFSVYAPLLSSSINRVFLIKRSIFIVYNDGQVFVKPVQFLEPNEVELVSAARSYVQRMRQFGAEAILVRAKLRKEPLELNALLGAQSTILPGEELVRGKTAIVETTSGGVDHSFVSLPHSARSISPDSFLTKAGQSQPQSQLQSPTNNNNANKEAN